MATQQYKDISFKRETLQLIVQMIDIVNEYTKQGFRLTVRQLYYQLVARGLIENTEKSYSKVKCVVNDARLAGYMDWDAIEDRTREFIRRTRWDSPNEILDQCAKAFHMDLWDNQPIRPFVIVEKEALAGVLEVVCHKLDVPLLAARGYPSVTVLREFALQDLIPTLDRGQKIVIFHLGDHDPSGMDMTRDLEDRLRMFCEDYGEFELERIALNMEQIRSQRPPPNPAKSTDARFKLYEARYGKKSWELDALSPTYLSTLVETHVMNLVDSDWWDDKTQQISKIRARLQKTAKDFKA